MSKRLRHGFMVFAFLFIGLVAAAAIFLYTADYSRYKELLEQTVMDATGRQLTIKGELTIAASLRPEIVVTDVALANALWGSQPQMLHIGQLRVRIKVIPLLTGEVDISRIRLIDTDLLLETDAGGQSNWQFDHKAGLHTGVGMRSVAVNQLEIEQLVVTLRSGDSDSPTVHYRLDSFELTRSAGADSPSIALKGSLNEQPVALSGQIGPLRDLFAGTRFPVDLSGEVASATATLHGEIANVLMLEGFDLAIHASGTNLATLGTGIGLEIPHTDSFDMMANLTGSSDGLSLQDARGSASYKSIQLAITGGISGLNAFEGIEFEVKGSGKDLADLRSIIIETLPQTGPFEISGKLTGTTDVLAFSDAQGTISHDSVKVTLAGGIGNLITLEGMDLKLKGAGKNLADLSSIFAETLPKTGPFEVSGKLAGTADVLAFSDAQGTIRHESVKVTLAGGIGNLITLEGIDLKLKGTGKDLAELRSIFTETLPQTGPFEVSGKLTGTADVLALSDVQGTVRHDSIKVSLTGKIDELVAMKGISMKVRASGKNLGELRSMLGDKLPRTGPFSATARLTGSAQVLTVRNLDGTVKQGNSQLSVSGKVGDLLQLTGLDLSLDGTGKELSELGYLFDTQLPDLGPFRIKAQLSGSDKQMDFKSVSATIDQSDLTGWAKAEFAKRLKVTLRLNSGLLDVTRIIQQVQSDKAEEKDKAETGVSRKTVFSDEPLPFDLLDAVDADIAFNAKKIKARDAELEFGQLALRFDDGELHIEKLEAIYEDAKVSANLDLTAGTPSKVAVKFLVQGFDLGRFLKETGASQDVKGKVDLAADLKSQGNSPRSLMANLDGVVGGVIGKGYMPRFLDLLAQDLTQHVTSIWGSHKEAGQLNCGVFQFTNKAGIATSDEFLFDTQLAILKGKGEINLATEQLDFVLSPEPKDFSLFSLATKLRASGSILDPSVMPDSKAAAKKGAKALSALVLGPAGLLVPFINLGAHKTHVCDIQALKSRIHSIYE